MDTFLGVLGIVISVGIALYEHNRAKKLEQMLGDTICSIPKRLEDISRMIGIRAVHGTKEVAANEQNTLFSRYADLNGDGEEELLVTYLSGLHNTALQVFGKRNFHGFALLGEIFSTTPTEFELVDVDGDGVLEVVTSEIADRPGLPYFAGLRDRVAHKLTENGFVEIKREKAYSMEDLKDVLAKVASPAQ